MSFSLDRLPDDCRHLAFESVGSTNALALHYGEQGDPGFLWISAQRQTEGRGRRGRAWVSDDGNLYASLLIVDDRVQGRDYSNLPLVMAIAIYEAVARTAGTFDGRLAIKWPNDLLVDGAKISGMLLEQRMLKHDRLALAIGFGVNCLTEPERGQVERQATSLKLEGAPVLPSDLLDVLSEQVLHWLRVWNLGSGLEAVLNAWRERAIGLGRAVTVRLPNEELSGTFEEIAQDGALMLRTADGGTRRVLAGDVFFSDGDRHA
ncbi:biotin--[acetyl-CoA-carboxylase] ligase [Coralliovum pocilloporae]|uniref:biotin--[acetyl-CoA-carboxylase] ligase n=1 Tax=Coralliovum pocilloporae TaxID=3066369 RepID=UPI00330737B2